MTSSPPARRFDWRNLAVRAGSATVLIPAVVAAVWHGGGPFLLLIAVSVGLLAIEWAKLSDELGTPEVAVTLTVAVLTAVFAAYVGWYRSAWLLLVPAAVVAFLAARGPHARPADAGYGVFYIAPSCIALVWLRATDNGAWWCLMLFATAWAADIFAFAFGNVIGGPKLWPQISPNKTWSGFLGGLLCATGAAAAFGVFAPMGVHAWHAALFGFLGGLATLAGDLWESLLKRRFGVKDSGEVIPGHGGLLDRVDGLMFAAIVFACARLVELHGWIQ